MFFGTRVDLEHSISYATGIDPAYLSHQKSIYEASIACRMFWASRRTTSRLEDIAYSLLGLFNVNLPLIYGEGGAAFFRLQCAIMERSDDESLFAWGFGRTGKVGLLARCPRDFAESRNVVGDRSYVDRAEWHPHPFQLTDRGIRYSCRELLNRNSKFPAHNHSIMFACKDVLRPGYHLVCQLRSIDNRGCRVALVWARFKHSRWRKLAQHGLALLARDTEVYISVDCNEPVSEQVQRSNARDRHDFSRMILHRVVCALLATTCTMLSVTLRSRGILLQILAVCGSSIFGL